MTTILPRRGTAAQWTSANPVLAMGEEGYETDTKKWKRGDGTTAWTALAYYQPSWNEVTAKPAVIAAGADQDAARAVIGAGKPYALTQTESNAGIISTQINDLWPPGHIYRYITNTIPGTTDVTTGWQLFLSLGGVIDLDARVNSVFRITAQLVIKSGTTLRMGPDCVMLRDWSAPAGSKYENAFFKNEHAPMFSELAVNPGPWTPSTTDDKIYIDGGRIRPVDSSKLGCGYYLVGTKNLVLRDTVVERTYQDWGFVVGGDNFSARGVRVEQNAAVFEDGFHILYGSGVVDADYIGSGDDCFAVGSNWNLPVNGVDIRMGRFRSEKGFAIKVIQNREGSTAGFANPTSLIQNVRFRDGSGKAGVSRNGLIMMTATGPGLLEDISVEGVALDADTQTHDGVNPYGVYCRYVTRLKLRDVKTKNHRHHAFWMRECQDVELTGLHAPYSSQTGTQFSLELQDCLNAKIVGGDFTHTTQNVIRMAGSTTAVFNGPVIQGVSNGRCGINVRDTSVASIHGATFCKSAGATSAIGILSGHATATIIADSCVFNVDQPYAQTAPAAYARLRNISRTVTVSTGAVTVRGDDNLKVLCESGVSDTLVSFSGGYKGQTVTIVNGEADPTTVVLTVEAGTGSDQFDIGTNFVLDTQYKMITVIFNGLNWIPIYKG